jgi:acyl carrier protein
MPELDSMAIVQLIVALEDHFGIEVDEDEITSDVFDTIGTLATFVASQS